MLTGIIPRPQAVPEAGAGMFHCFGELVLDRGGFEVWCFTAFAERLKKKGVILTDGG